MGINSSLVNNVLVIKYSDAVPTIPEIEKEFEKAGSNRWVTLNLSQLGYIHRNNLGLLVNGLNWLQHSSAAFKICCLSEQLRALHATTNAFINFQVFDSEAEAIADFNP